MKNANCKLFEDIARWVVQDEGYKSMDTLVNRINTLEKNEQVIRDLVKEHMDD